MSSYRSKLTDKLVAPKNKKDFIKDWARRILVDYMCRTDPDWLLGDVLKVIDVTAKDNPHPGMLSDSYVVEVTYKQGEEDLDQESWFVKVPKSNATALKDEVEVFVYNKMFPTFQEFADLKTRSDKDSIQMPIPIVFHACFDEDNKDKNHLVMENLRDQGYRPLRPETCGLVFMRAAMTSLATVHGTAYANQHELGGKAAFLSKFPVLTEDNMPRSKLLKNRVETLILPYLFYMGHVQPDLQPQLALLTKFHRFLLGVYHTLRRDKELNNLKILIHGDSKIDNFMFKKSPGSIDDHYIALIIDWQGACYDLLSGDLMWTLYGFMKNLPDKNSTVDTFLDYSISVYHQELLRILRKLKVDPDDVNVPTHEYDATTLIKKGFVKEFLQTVIIKPLIVIKNPDLLLEWFNNRDRNPVPKESDIFKSGSNYVNFIHLYFTIATETGVFHDLASMCITAMKESMFGKGDVDEGALDDTDDEWERSQAAKQTVITEDEKAELAKILGQNYTPYSEPEPVPNPVVEPVVEPVVTAPSELSVPSSENTENLSNGYEPTELPVEKLQNGIHAEKSSTNDEIAKNDKASTTNELTVTGNGETEFPTTRNDVTTNNFEEEVVTGVVYIRTNSMLSESNCQLASEVTSAEPVVGKVPEETNVNEVTKENGSVNPATEVVVESIEKPVLTTKTKRRKKTSGSGPGIRNRANKAKEVQTIHTIEEKLKELKSNIRLTTDSLFELSELARHCHQTSDNVLLKMNLQDLNQSLANFFTVCAEEIINYRFEDSEDEEKNNEQNEIELKNEQNVIEQNNVQNENELKNEQNEIEHYNKQNEIELKNKHNEMEQNNEQVGNDHKNEQNENDHNYVQVLSKLKNEENDTEQKETGQKEIEYIKDHNEIDQNELSHLRPENEIPLAEKLVLEENIGEVEFSGCSNDVTGMNEIS